MTRQIKWTRHICKSDEHGIQDSKCAWTTRNETRNKSHKIVIITHNLLITHHIKKKRYNPHKTSPHKRHTLTIYNQNLKIATEHSDSDSHIITTYPAPRNSSDNNSTRTRGHTTLRGHGHAHTEPTRPIKQDHLIRISSHNADTKLDRHTALTRKSCSSASKQSDSHTIHSTKCSINACR